MRSTNLALIGILLFALNSHSQSLENYSSLDKDNQAAVKKMVEAATCKWVSELGSVNPGGIVHTSLKGCDPGYESQHTGICQGVVHCESPIVDFWVDGITCGTEKGQCPSIVDCINDYRVDRKYTKNGKLIFDQPGTSDGAANERERTGNQ